VESGPRRFGGLSPDRLEPTKAWIKATEAALLAVLRLHPAETHECPGEDQAWGKITVYESTCPTLLAIAEVLEIEAPLDGA